MIWRETDLLEYNYPGLSSFSGRTLLGDNCIEKLVTCGELIDDYDHLQQHVRWALGEADEGVGPSDLGQQLISELVWLYKEVDAERKTQEQESYVTNTQTFEIITPATFDGPDYNAIYGSKNMEGYPSIKFDVTTIADFEKQQKK